MGNKKDASTSLKEAISALEIRQAEEIKLLKDELVDIHEKLKPINLVKDAFEEVAYFIEHRKGLMKSLIGVFTGFLTQRIVIGSKPGLFKKLAGVLLNYGIAALISKYAETIKILGLQLLNQLVGEKKIENPEPAQNGME